MMKRVGNLFERIVGYDNLRIAAAKAFRGKRLRHEVREFQANFDSQLEILRLSLIGGNFPVGQFRQFVITDPKERVITAPCLGERIFHHAIMRVCEPVFEKWLIDDTFACRVGRGRDAALARTLQFASRRQFYLKMDIRKYFDSIPHTELLLRLARRFKDKHLLKWFEKIVSSFRSSLGRGLPIGSLMSQHFANFYLGWFDRFAKETLHCRAYVRYMDDIAIWADSTTELLAVRSRCDEFLTTRLGLELKPTPIINRTKHGMEFLGCRVFPRHLGLNRRSRVRFARRLRWLIQALECATICQQEFQQRATSLVAFTRASGVQCWKYRTAALQRLMEDGQEAPSG